MAYRLELTPRVEKQLDNLPPTDRRRVAARIDLLSENPHPPGAVRMQGVDDAWRLRIGDWRVIYEIHDAVPVVLALRVGHRGEAHRQRG